MEYNLISDWNIFIVEPLLRTTVADNFLFCEPLRKRSQHISSHDTIVKTDCSSYTPRYENIKYKPVLLIMIPTKID